jgi:hypothetical protein
MEKGKCTEDGCEEDVIRPGAEWCRKHNPDRCGELTASGRECRNERATGRMTCQWHAEDLTPRRGSGDRSDPVVEFLREQNRFDLAGSVLRMRMELRRLRGEVSDG